MSHVAAAAAAAATTAVAAVIDVVVYRRCGCFRLKRCYFQDYVRCINITAIVWIDTGCVVMITRGRRSLVLYYYIFRQRVRDFPLSRCPRNSKIFIHENFTGVYHRIQILHHLGTP